jgi:hypothetical protein
MVLADNAGLIVSFLGLLFELGFLSFDPSPFFDSRRTFSFLTFSVSFLALSFFTLSTEELLTRLDFSNLNKLGRA